MREEIFVCLYLSGADVKYNRNDTSSPVPSTLTTGPHGQQTPFINTPAPLHPFGYAGNLAFYHGGGMIGGFATPYTAPMYQVCRILFPYYVLYGNVIIEKLSIFNQCINGHRE